MKNRKPIYNLWSAASVFFVSIAIIALQLMIMRALSVSHYYHFSYLVISTALLGFGASGTFLALFYNKLKNRFALWNLIFFLGFTVSIPVTYWITQLLPLDTQYLLHSGEQITLLVIYNLVLPSISHRLRMAFLVPMDKKKTISPNFSDNDSPATGRHIRSPWSAHSGGYGDKRA